MKRLIIPTLLGFFLATSALAGWIEDFSVNTQKQGLDIAVAEALRVGQHPNNIVEEGLKIDGVSPQHLLKALYCEGSDGDDVKMAAGNAGISDIILISAFKKSKAECGDTVADSQAYTPINKGISFAGMPSPVNSTSQRILASPSTP